MSTDLASLITDLNAESAELDNLVAELPPERWPAQTPAAGWTIAHQIAHLAWTDHAAVLSATDPGAFDEVLRKAWENPTDSVDLAAGEGARTPPAELLRFWRNGRIALASALLALPPKAKLRWFGPPMGAASMVTARLMETWAHGHDVADALGAVRPSTNRLRHVAHLGVRTINFAFTVHNLPLPDTEFRVELTGPHGDLWTWGPDTSPDRITGPALDFCQLVTQRRNLADLAVTAQGERAEQWLPIAQAFAGPPGGGRKAGEFA